MTKDLLFYQANFDPEINRALDALENGNQKYLEIFKNKTLKIEELLEEMETIVASGTKLNLDYAIEDLVEEDEREEIIDYFKGCQTSSLDTAREELADGNYSLEQLKIMRIKFLCEYGN